MKKNGVLLYNIFLVIGDCLGLVAAFAAAFLLRVRISDAPIAEPTSGKNFILAFLVLLPFWILIFALLGLYRSNIYEKRFREIGTLFIGSFIGMLFIVFLSYLSEEPLFPARLVPIYGFAIAFVLLVLIRSTIRAIQGFLFRKGRGITNLILVGNTEASDEISHLLMHKSSGYRILGVVGDKRRSFQADYTDFNEALKALEHEDIHGIIQTELYANEARNQEVLSYAQTHHISYRFVPGNTELFVGNIQVDLFKSSIPVIAVHQTPLLGWGQVAKRIFDLIVSGILIGLSSPLLLIIAILEKCSTKGSIFFRQTRVTRYNQPFRVYKFRSQYAKYDGTTPEEAFAMMGKPELAIEYRANGDQLTNDPRVTPLGKFIRKTSLDELPQLFNVFKGELSLVGPRPLIPQEIGVFNRKHAILSIKPGLTGLAVVSGRRDISFEERRKLDMYYVQNWNFWLDITILFKTVRVVLSRRGAK